MRVICILLSALGAPFRAALAAELVSSNYQFGDLRLQYLPPENDGGEPVTKYKIEWDASSGDDAPLPPFTPSSRYFGSAEVANVREEQEVVVSCRNACGGTFALSWGGRVTDELRVDATAEEVELALRDLFEPFDLHSDGSSIVRVTRKANGFAFKWRVAFLGVGGDLGLIRANGDLLVGSGAMVRVVEVTRGSGDLYPGAYTNEVQTVSVRKRSGFDCESISGSFDLQFEGKVTPSIDVEATADDFKEALESLPTIHTVNVKTDHHDSTGAGDCASRSWIVTFTHLVHENRQGAGDIGLLRLSSSSLTDPAVTQVDVFENVKGTNPRAFNIRGLEHGLTYHCRVSAYNSLGYGVSSSTVTATPKVQPPPPLGPVVSIPQEVDNLDDVGTSLSVSWQTGGQDDGGDPVAEYKVEWYSAVENFEVQKLTTSAADGIVEVQSIKTSADTDGITGFFTLTFDGETTELISHDAEADGEESIEMKLERLSTIGDIEVSRDYSWASVPTVEFDLSTGSNVLSWVGGSLSGDLADVFAVGDLIRVGVQTHVVSSVGSSFVMTSESYLGPSASAVHIHKWSFGHEWQVTFASHVGKQPLLEASPANNWAGTNPVIEISRVREGLQPLSGTMRLGFEGERTLPIPFDASASLVKQALESLSSIGEVDVARYQNNNGQNYFVVFLSELGDREQMTIDDSQLTGPDARARVATLLRGTQPSSYGSASIQNPSESELHIKGLDNGVPYFVRIRSRNSKGFGYAAIAYPSPMTPMKRPSSPTSPAMFPLSNTHIRITWQASELDGGSPITKYAVHWDTEPNFPNAWVVGYFYEVFVEEQTDAGAIFCHTFAIDADSSDEARYGRVLAFNGYQWSDYGEATVLSATVVAGKPGPVSDFNAFPTSNIGMMLTWSHPSIDDQQSCGYDGDGGFSITHYVIEYDEEADFSTPAASVTAPSTSTELRIGGRDVLSGSESPLLKESGTYYARITPFNSDGPGTTTTFPHPIGPLADTDPSAPLVHNAMAVTASSVQVQWNAPTFDGGSAIREYVVEYDTSPDWNSTPRNTTIPTISEVKALQVGSADLELAVQRIQATVAVTNEVQSITTSVDGVDEVQEITTTCDDVTAEVQMIATTAVDTNEEQVVSLISDDIDEIQLVRLQGENQVEMQSVQVSVPRVNEVQKFGVVISNINTDGDGVHSTACMGVSAGDPCPDIENALGGSFTVSFDFDACGSNGSGGVNYCQLAFSKYEPSLGTVSCSPGLVTDPYSGGDHCVSEPITHTYSSSEGDAGTLQQVLVNLVDDNGVSFMTSSNVPGKQEAVTVTRTGRIKTKSSCTLDVGSDPATCMGEYELMYEIAFDGVLSSGDVPPLTVVTSDFRLDTASASYVDVMCPAAHFVHGCEEPVGGALDSDHASFYNGESGSAAVESTKGFQPTGMITLDYECESLVTALPGGHSMTVSTYGMSASFDDVGFVGNMAVGQWIRFSAGDGIDHYRRIAGSDDAGDTVSFESAAPVNGAVYADVEFGDYFSDWDESDGGSGVSSHCQASRTHATLPIDVDIFNSATSVTDWRGKIGAMSVIDSSGISVERNLVSDLSTDIGLIWDVTFQKQPGNVHEMTCSSVSGTNECSVNTLQESSVIGGDFKLQTTWPHEYVSETPQPYETGSMRWNGNAQTLKAELESITDANGDKVFGFVGVSRVPYVPPSHSRWSGGYLWTITFLSRGGNIPALTFDHSALTGNSPFLEVSDEDSGEADLYQGVPNSASFSADDPGLARDGNQITGSFSLSWSGNAYHDAVASTGNVFTVQTGGSSSDQYTALSAEDFKALFEEHVLLNSMDQVDVVRSEQPTQWMGYSYTIAFRHEDLGGDVPPLTYMLGSALGGSNSYAHIEEGAKGTELVGTFQLRFEGETTRPINHDATALDVQEALNELNSILPSNVVVSGGDSPVRSGPSDGAGGMSTEVGGRIWYVTFASNTWKDPTVVHDGSFVPGNWVGPPASFSDTWSSGFSKAWGKNVGNVPMISCLQSGLSTTNGALPDGGCSISELVAGTDPLGGSFKVCLDSASNPNNVMSVESDACTDFIAHNAVASAVESGGDGTSMEEKLEELANVGDVTVTRSAVNERNGGYTWRVQFLHDADGPCEQKDDMASFCNAPGNVPKLCDDTGATPCDTDSLSGTCLKPGSCQKLTVLDASDKQNGARFPGGNEKQMILVKDSDYVGWDDGSVIDNASISKEYKLVVDGVATGCIKHNALAEEMRTSIQAVLDGGIGGSVHVHRSRSEHLAENGFVYFLTFYDAGNVGLLSSSFSDGQCADDFESSQSVVISPVVDGDLHASTCADCADGIVQRGEFTTFGVTGSSLSGTLVWNAEPVAVKAHLEQTSDRVVDVTRRVLDQYGTIEWMVTFTQSQVSTPPGSGDIDPITVAQDSDTSGQAATVVVNEIVKGSEGLSGTFSLDYQASGGPRSFSFDESPQRMSRKLEEMSTIGRVFVSRDCYPSCSSGGWGGTAVTTGTFGGFVWTIHFLKNPGSNNGFTFPPGSGNVYPPAIDHTTLLGKDAAIIMEFPSEGSAPLTGSFSLVINDEGTESIPYNIDSSAMEYTINDLQSVGEVSVKSGLQTDHSIAGITASVLTDGTVTSLVGGDLREHLGPGDSFRIGGSSTEVDGAEHVGSVSLSPLSPILSDVQLNHRNHLNVGETVRIAADMYSIVRNGVEVQQIAVHRAESVAGGDFYQLKVAIQGVEETTSCLSFDASGSEVQQALNDLSILSDAGGVLVTRTDTSSGLAGDAHVYKVYFTGSGLVGDVEELVAEQCATGVPPGVDSTNSHIHVRTLIQGGKTEHQRVTLSSDSGSTSDAPAFRLTITDSDANSWESPCFAWGTPSLGISSLIDVDSFSSVSLTVDSVTDLENGLFNVGATSFVEGAVLSGDYVNPGKRCPGHVLSIGTNGQSFVIDTSSTCTATPGDALYVGSDVAITDSFTDNGASVSEISVVTLFSNAEIIESDDGLWKLRVEFQGAAMSTSCLPYGATAQQVQQEIGGLFDYNQDGVIDSSDADHITTSREGDGSSSSGYGYTYKFLSNGSSSTIGSSAVLGTNAPQFSVVDVGADGGCLDYGVEEALVTSTASTTDESNTISLGSDATVAITAGARLRASSSLESSKVYTVDHTSDDGSTLVLTEYFAGSTTVGTTTLHLISGGSLHFNVNVAREGVDQYAYDIFFSGSHWKNVPELAVNTFGDGTCSASNSDMSEGMSRGIGIKTIVDGGGTELGAESDRYVLDRAVRRETSESHNLFVVPPVLSIHSDSSEVQRIIIKDDDNGSIWGSGQPSFKLTFGGESTGCLDYDASDVEIENALNSMSSICPGLDPCVTVTRSEDPVLAPNGYVHAVYFDSSSAARKDVADPGVDGLQADTAHSDCTAFDFGGGEQIVIDALAQGKSSAEFSSLQVPFGGSPVGRWLGESQTDLPVYRVSGTFWFVRFGQTLGNVQMSIDSTALSSNALSSTEEGFFDGANPDRVVIPNLSTGIPYFFRVYYRTSLGFSPPSAPASAIPSDSPEKLRNVSSGHALHRREVQSVVIAASRRREVQAVQTSAIAIPEVQEITLTGQDDSDMNSYLFSLRHPEIQVVKWAAGSPVTAGSFFLKMRYVDRVNSDISGAVVYKELKTPCINFDASADDVKRAMETDAVLNRLGTNSVRVTRSGNRSFSSDHGYSYTIHFVGSDVRGNVLQLTSDLSLSGMDSNDGNSCTAFVSSTNDASLAIWTENDSQALGTDTPRAEVILDANTAIVGGEFQLSVTHFGQELTTECIPWDSTAEQVKSALENLDNVDQVRVERTGGGMLSDDGARLAIDQYTFEHVGGNNFLASTSDGLADVLFEGDVIKLSGQSDPSTFYEISSFSGATLTLDKSFDGDSTVPSYITRYFGYRNVVYFDGNAMHTDGMDSSGYMPAQGSNFVVTEPNSCNPMQAYHNNVLKGVSEIPDAIANVRAVSKYDGEHTLPGAPSGTSSSKISAALTSSLPMTVSEAHVTQSLETSDNGLTFTVTMGNAGGDVPLLVCNQSPSLTSLVGCDSSTVMDGNEIRGEFYLESSDPIPYNASPSEMESALSGVFGIGRVEVSRSQPDGQEGYTWLITFSDDHGDVTDLHASNSLTGKGATVTVTEITKGNELGGSFTLSFGSETTDAMPFDVDVATLHSALEALDGIGKVDVHTDGHVDSELGRLTGSGGTVWVTEEVKGSLAAKDALHMSFDFPHSCSTSDVGRPHCGNSITEAVIEFSQDPDFSGASTSYQYSPDYSIQYIRTSYAGDQPPEQLSGYFNVAYDGSLSAPINAHASAETVRVALEGLPGIGTASVERGYAHQVIPGVCVDVTAGSSLVECSSACSPCDFAAKGIKANKLIMVGDEWRRVSSSYDGVLDSFEIASVDDSSIKMAYVGESSLSEWALRAWTGGYEWEVSLHDVSGEAKPFSSPVHHMLPPEAAIEIASKDCDKCLYVDNLSPGTQYYVRARVKNDRGWSAYSDSIEEIPRAIPSAPADVRVDALSGECLEVTFYPPVYGQPLTSYVVQWDHSELFTSAEGDSASCTSLGHGSCVLTQPAGSPPVMHEICGLVESEEYHVRVAARNSVVVQSIYPDSPGNPKDNTNWSGSISATPLDQVPDPPSSLDAAVLGDNSLQLSFDWPERDGGKEITEFVVVYDTTSEMSIPPTLPQMIPSSSDRFVFDFVPTNPQLDTGTTHFVKLRAVNDVGNGEASSVVSVIPSGPPAPPSTAVLTTLQLSELPVTEATVSWAPPVSDGGHPIDGYFVEWWSQDRVPEVQIVRLLYTSLLSETTFTLSFSPSPTVKKETSNLPWNAPPDLVRREILNLGWDEVEDMVVIGDVKVTRSTLANGYQWMITFGDNPDRSLNDGDQVSFFGSIMENGDSGSPSISVSTLQDGQRSVGSDEVQYLQVRGSGALSGQYRLKFVGSEWTTFVPIHSSASYIKAALEQLSTVGEVEVTQNDGVDQSLIGTEGDLVHHFEVQFRSNPGNVEAMVVDSSHVASSDDVVSVVVFDGSNSLDSLNTKQSAAIPGELPVHYGNSGILASTDESFQITGLITGTEYFVAVSARNHIHGLSKRMVPSPSSITPPLQQPGVPQGVSIGVNTGYSDSLVVNFDPPESNGGSPILFYRVELDPTPSFDSPIVQDFECPANNKRTEWVIETSADGGGVIDGGSFRLELEVDGFTSMTSEIPYDAVALSSNETGISEELIPTFSTSAGSNSIATIPPVDIEDTLFPGDRLRFSGQSAMYKYYEVQSVAGSNAILTETFVGDDGVQVSTTRHHGGRGNPLSSRIHCQYDEDLCPTTSEPKSGSMQGKLEDLSLAIQRGVFVDRDGPNTDNGFIWRITFLDDAYPLGSDYSLRVHSNSLTTFGNQGIAHVSASLLNSGQTYTSCTGSLVMPSYGGLVKGLEYHGRVSARNSEGYSLPVRAPEPIAPMVIPSAPTGVTLDVVSATELRVIFGSPSDNGGDTITQYLIEWSTSSDFSDSRSSTLDYLAGGSPFFHNIGGLVTGTYYFVRVSAKNSQGYGISQMTTPSSLNPHQKPSPPTNVKLGITSDTMLTIGWAPPLSNGGDTLSKYRVEWDTKASFESSSYPPNKGYVDVDSLVLSHTIQLLSSQKTYHLRVYAMNSAGSSVQQLSTPSLAVPSLQVPGSPHSLQASAGSSAGTVEVAWQRPKVPNSGIPCFSEGGTVKDCPTPYGGSLPASDGGDTISEYELEWNERSDFLGTDGGRKTYTGVHAVLSHLYSGRIYFLRVLARNSIGSGKYGEVVSVQVS
ncbi:hypothetical protein ACHAWF_018557 [Thalassiosira exigua]